MSFPPPGANTASAMARLESQALLAQENYSAALLEGVAALTCLEAVRMLESVRAMDLAAQVKESLEDALGSNDAFRMSDVHALALNCLAAAGIEHDLPDSTPPGVPLGLRRSSLKPRDVTPKQTRHNAAPKVQQQGRVEKMVNGAAGLRLVRRTSIVAWAIVFLGLAGLFAFMSVNFARQRANRIVQSHRVANTQLHMPRLTFCYSQPDFPAVQALGAEGCKSNVDGGTADGLPCPGGAGTPLFAVSRISISERRAQDDRTSDLTASPHSFEISRLVRSTGATKQEKERCRQTVEQFDVNVHKEWESTEVTGATCQACLQVSSREYVYKDAKDSVSVELAVDKAARFCFDPWARLDLLTRVVPGITAYLSDNLNRFADAGVLDLNGLDSPLEQVPFILDFSGNTFIPKAFAIPLSKVRGFGKGEDSKRDEIRRQFVELLCNVYFFSGVVHPAKRPNIKYKLDQDSGTWQRVENSGPYFEATWLNYLTLGAAAFNFEQPNPDQRRELEPALDLFVTSLDGPAAMLTKDAGIDLLRHDTWKYLRVQEESRIADNVSRYLPLASSEVYLQRHDDGSTGEVATHFSMFQMNFGFGSLETEVSSVSDVVSVSSFVADIVNTLEVVLGLSLFSILLRSLSALLE